MDYIGTNWNTKTSTQLDFMRAFCGQDRILIDANGRFKLPPHVIGDFLAGGSGDIVFYCLPEGALAIYPEKVFDEIRRQETADIQQIGSSMLRRRSMRQFGAWSASAAITQQGRLTLPLEFRAPTGLQAGSEAIIIGVEIGVEVWNLSRWQREQQLIREHEMSRGELELANDLKIE
ncbi:MAG: hypothetical protein E7052_07575 [Lentisphaerae bacterium]|nr:hypothetical protein [Lentisphaerota bacterium]